jgi:hypothetical protein
MQAIINIRLHEYSESVQVNRIWPSLDSHLFLLNEYNGSLREKEG